MLIPPFGQSTLWLSGLTWHGSPPPSESPPKRVKRMLVPVSKPAIWSTPASPS